MPSPPRLAGAAALFFLLVVSGLFYRLSRNGLELRDFRDGMYYAAVAMLDGGNPYDTPRYLHSYPVEQAYSPYMPGFLLLHLPFALLPFSAAQGAYFITVVSLAIGLAALSLRVADVRPTAAGCLTLGSLLLLSRPGSWNLGLGQFSLQFAIGSVLALAYARQKPVLAACGLAVALLKPTYGLPLVILLAATQRWRVLAGGSAVAALLSAPPLIALMVTAGGVVPFLTALQESYASFSADPGAAAATGPERADVISLVGRSLDLPPPLWLELGVTCSVVGIGAVVYRRLVAAAKGTTPPLALAVALLTMILCVYHQTYDLVLLVTPLVVLACGLASARAPILQLLLIALLTVPMLNYLSPQAVQDRLGTAGALRSVLTSLNAMTLLVAFGVALAAARHEWRPSRQGV